MLTRKSLCVARHHWVAGLSSIVLLASPMQALASSTLVSVPGTSNPWLAGMPAGSTASSGDKAGVGSVFQSPVLVSGLSLHQGGWLRFSGVQGGVDNDPGCVATCDEADGGGFISHLVGAENGMAGLKAPINALVGVFLGNDQPDFSTAPAALDFSTVGLSFQSLSPELKQVFFIGDGLGTANQLQQFNIPVGASRLFLGTMDGYGWYNNSGSFSVSVEQIAAVPEPESWAMFLAGLGMTVFAVKRRSAIPGSLG